MCGGVFRLECVRFPCRFGNRGISKLHGGCALVKCDGKRNVEHSHVIPCWLWDRIVSKTNYLSTIARVV